MSEEINPESREKLLRLMADPALVRREDAIQFILRNGRAVVKGELVSPDMLEERLHRDDVLHANGDAGPFLKLSRNELVKKYFNVHLNGSMGSNERG